MKENHGFSYHLCPILEDVELKDAAAFVYSYATQREMRSRCQSLLRLCGPDGTKIYMVTFST